jgi:hypothetical protein
MKYLGLMVCASLAALLCLLAGCTVSFETGGGPKPTPSAVPSAEGVEVGTRVGDLIRDMIGFGLAESPADFEGIPFGFTVVDGDRPVPFARLVVDLDTLGRLVIGRANEQGQLSLAFTATFLRRNPTVFGERGGRFYGVRFDMTADAAAGERLAQVDVATLEARDVGPDVVFASPSVPEATRATFADALRRQRAFMADSLRLAPVPWGAALVDTSGSVALSPSQIQRGDRLVKTFPYALRNEPLAAHIAVNLHEWVELSLEAMFETRLPRFVGDGLAEHAQLAFYRTLTPEERAALDADGYVRRFVEQLQDGLADDRGERDTFNLFDWPYAGPDYTLRDRSMRLGYRASASFWYEVTQAEGEAAIRALMARLPREGAISSAEVVATLAAITGTDYTERLRRYPLDAVADYYDALGDEITDND